MNLDHDSLHDPKQFIARDCKDFSSFFVWKMTSNNASLLVMKKIMLVMILISKYTSHSVYYQLVYLYTYRKIFCTCMFNFILYIKKDEVVSLLKQTKRLNRILFEIKSDEMLKLLNSLKFCHIYIYIIKSI